MAAYFYLLYVYNAWLTTIETLKYYDKMLS